MEDNLISELRQDMFFGLGGLLHLQVRGNQIAALDDERLLYAFNELETFDARDNRIESIAPFIFSPFQSTLKEIYLDGNELSHLNGLEFAGLNRSGVAPLTALTDLSLEGNGLESVRSYPPTEAPPGWDADDWAGVWSRFSTTPSWGEWDTFSQLPGLLGLDLSGNALEASDLSRALFENLDSLATLRLSDNPLGSFDPQWLGGMSQPFNSGLLPTFSLYLAGVGLSSLPTEPFAGYSGFQTLDLSRNSLTSLHADTFRDQASMWILELQDNELASLPDNLFRNNSGLVGVNLARNNLTSLHEDTFDAAEGLENLDLSDNALTSLHEDFFELARVPG